MFISGICANCRSQTFNYSCPDCDTAEIEEKEQEIENLKEIVKEQKQVITRLLEM